MANYPHMAYWPQQPQGKKGTEVTQKYMVMNWPPTKPSLEPSTHHQAFASLHAMCPPASHREREMCKSMFHLRDFDVPFERSLIVLSAVHALFYEDAITMIDYTSNKGAVLCKSPNLFEIQV